ncbi:MAG TPA: cytochrome c peroxidase [Gemmatimonadaceae bacterium]|nr:cytochrome c peroxidase [Gemmatimonadaceae bacterium]
MATTVLRRSRTARIVLGLGAAVLVSSMIGTVRRRTARWTPAELALLGSLSIRTLEPLGADPSNRYATDTRAASLGQQLFFDARLSGNAKVSCATCHVAAQDFQDSKPLADGVGRTARRTMPIAGTAHSPWLFWDGRADSQWAQALGPLESAVEHGGSRTQYAHVVAEQYRAQYEAVFGALPDLTGLPRHAGPVDDTTSRAAWQHMPAGRRDDVSRLYANIGKAIAAYERRIEPGASRVDRYIDAEVTGAPHTSASALTSDEEAGLRLFIGRGRCVTCHNGPLLTDDHFHNTGVPLPGVALPPDSGRAAGGRKVVAGEFNCTSRYSDAKPEDCEELRFAVTDGAELVRAYKTPSLRNVAGRAPYMHAGQLASLPDVVAHYAAAPAAPFGHSELKPVRLSPNERGQLVAFLQALTAPLSAPAAYLEPPAPRR